MGLKSIGKPTTLHSIYDYPLVVLSLLIAISASYAALTLAARCSISWLCKPRKSDRSGANLGQSTAVYVRADDAWDRMRNVIVEEVEWFFKKREKSQIETGRINTTGTRALRAVPA